MKRKRCDKCHDHFPENEMVRCKNCSRYFNSGCVKELCNDAGEFIDPPTKNRKWTCSKCLADPERVRKNSKHRGCSKCGAASVSCECKRHSRDMPGLGEATREDPQPISAWHDDKMFAGYYARYPKLWQEEATEEERWKAYEYMACDLRITDVVRLPKRCRQFAARYNSSLRRLVLRHRTPKQILNNAPAWIQRTEARLNWLPKIIKSLWIPEQPEEVLAVLARSMRSEAAGRERRARVTAALAARLPCAVSSLEYIWNQYCRIALLKLQALSGVGDLESILPPPARLSPHEWLAADTALAHSAYSAEWLVNSSNSELGMLHLLLRLVQQYQLEEADPKELKARWICALKDYTNSGLKSSAVVLQRRWWELKVETNARVRRILGGCDRALRPHHALIVRRYPSVVTKPVPGWLEYCATRFANVTDEDVSNFKEKVEPLPVAEDDLILQEAKNLETPEEPPLEPFRSVKLVKVESVTSVTAAEVDIRTRRVVEQLQRDVAELRDLDQMQNMDLQPIIQEYDTAINKIVEKKDEEHAMNDSLKALEQIDPSKATTSIIFESDSDTDGETHFSIDEGIDNDVTMNDDNLEGNKLGKEAETSTKRLEIDVVSEKNGTEENYDSIKNNEKKTDGTEMNVDLATDPKLKMVACVPLVRIEELVKSKGLQLESSSHLIATKIGTLQDKKASQRSVGNIKEIEGSQLESSSQLIPKVGSKDDRRSLEGLPQDESSSHLIPKVGTIVDQELLEERPQVESSSHQNKPEVVMGVGPQLESSSHLNTPKASTKDKGSFRRSVEGSKGSEGSRVRPWGYKGSLSGRVEELEWLCTAVSVPLEKLPEEVLSNVEAGWQSRPVWLPDIEEVRRHHKRQLVAQVAPLNRATRTYGNIAKQRPPSRTQSVESSASGVSSTSLEDYGLLTRLPENDDSELPVSEKELQSVLSNVQVEAPKRFVSCCLARRHRDYNDAKRRSVARAGRTEVPAEFDMHGARHGLPPYTCNCCCLRLLSQTPSNLPSLQRTLLRDLASLLKRRGEYQLDASESLKRSIESPCSSEDERLVIDSSARLKQKRSSEKNKRKKTTDNNTEEKDTEKQSKKEKSKAHTHKDTPRTKQNEAKDDSDPEKKKRDDLIEWMRQKNSHRWFFKPPGSKAKEKESISLDHTYAANLTSKIQAYNMSCSKEREKTELSNTESKLNATYIVKNLPANDRNCLKDREDIIPIPIPKLDAKDVADKANIIETNSGICLKNNEEQNPVKSIANKSQDIEIIDLDSDDSSPAPTITLIDQGAKLIGSTLLPVVSEDQTNVLVTTQANQKIPTQSTNVVNQATNYFMIYQPTVEETKQSAPNLAIIPITITVQQPEIYRIPALQTQNTVESQKQSQQFQIKNQQAQMKKLQLQQIPGQQLQMEELQIQQLDTKRNEEKGIQTEQALGLHNQTQQIQLQKLQSQQQRQQSRNQHKPPILKQNKQQQQGPVFIFEPAIQRISPQKHSSMLRKRLLSQVSQSEIMQEEQQPNEIALWQPQLQETQSQLHTEQDESQTLQSQQSQEHKTQKQHTQECQTENKSDSTEKTDKMTISRENFRQKLVQNLCLLSGGGVTEGKIKFEDDETTNTEQFQPMNYDESPETPISINNMPVSVITSSLPTSTTSIPTFTPSTSNYTPFLTIVPTLKTSVPTLTSSLPTFSTQTPTIATRPTVIQPMTKSEPALPPLVLISPTDVNSLMTNVNSQSTSTQIGSSLPTISNVTSLANSSIDLVDDDDDDDVVIPTPAAKKTKHSRDYKVAKSVPPQFMYPDMLSPFSPEHVSLHWRGEWGEDGPALLRVNGAEPLWALPTGELVLTDTPVSCTNIRYFIIGSDQRRPQPVRFARDQPRIKVRSFAKMAADNAAPADSPPAPPRDPPSPPTEDDSDLIMRDNKLYKPVPVQSVAYGNDQKAMKTVVAKVYTALSQVLPAELLLSSGYPLYVYSPATNKLSPVRADVDIRTLFCEGDSLAAKHIASNFNDELLKNKPRSLRKWAVKEPLQ